MNLLFKKQILSLFIVAILITLSQSCMNEQSGINRSTGKMNEILIVTNDKDQWNSEVGDLIRSVFAQEQQGLPQPEPMFDLINIADASLNKTFKKVHNIFIVDINPSFENAIVETKENLWAKPQRVIKITAPDIETFKYEFNLRKDAFLNMFNELEINRINQTYKMASDIAIKNKLIKKFGFSMEVPGGFAVAKESENFIWLRQTVHKIKQDAEIGILIYKYPYTDTLAFIPARILNLRDSITKQFVEGPSKNSYMAISSEFIPPVHKQTGTFVTDFAIETRGLWKVENDFMGGPFISFTFVHSSGEQIITLDGYAYNPMGMKKDFVRQLESIFYTLKFEI